MSGEAGMEVIRGLGALRAPSRAAGQARGVGGFRVPQARTAASSATVGLEGASGAEEVGLAGMLALQEMPDRDVADRAARRRGQDLLAALAAMQRAMLGLGDGDGARLEQLAAGVPRADDPALRDVVAAIALRARIEAARLSMRSESNSPNTIESS